MNKLIKKMESASNKVELEKMKKELKKEIKKLTEFEREEVNNRYRDLLVDLPLSHLMASIEIATDENPCKDLLGYFITLDDLKYWREQEKKNGN